MDPISAAATTAFSGLSAQSIRMKVIAENIANAQSTGKTAGADPYRRKLVSFANVLDETKGASMVQVDQAGVDKSAFRIEHIPGHPAADAQGNVKLPNVDMIVEMADMKEALHSYDANLQVIRQGREMMSGLVDLLRSNG
jgi:flagellar basal-body rod protein FlgC